MASMYSCDFDVNQTKIKVGYQSGRKVLPNNLKSDLPLVAVVILTCRDYSDVSSEAIARTEKRRQTWVRAFRS